MPLPLAATERTSPIWLLGAGRTRAAVPILLVFAGACEEFTCEDYATCPVEGDASVNGQESNETASTHSTAPSAVTSLAMSTAAPTSTAPTSGHASTQERWSSTTGPQTTQEVQLDGGNDEDGAVVPGIEKLELGKPCGEDSVCASGVCSPGWSTVSTTGVCCAEACADAQRCGASGQCQNCEPGRVEACWSTETGEPLAGSPSGLIGDCHEGERTCRSDATWSACVGAVGPLNADTCERPGADEDCDGQPNEDCTCIEDETRVCGSDVGNCVAGTQTCKDGKWSQCDGEVAPLAQDSCAIEDDDANCDGVPNDGCSCIGEATQPCGDCGNQTCNPDTREWGECIGEAQPRCRDGSTTIMETCNAQGQWEASTCTFLCAGGACSGECAPGFDRCLQNPERRQTCNGGNWDTIETCPNGSQCVNDGAECRKSSGGSCTGDNQCVSGHCVDGICCETDCAPVSCTALNSQCLTHPPTASDNLCDGSGQCRSAEDVCAEVASAVEAGVSCTFPNLPGGECDGAGNCAAPTVVCGNQTCSLDAEVCCERAFKTDASYLECAASEECVTNQEPAASGPDRSISCDEDKDCDAGKVCGHLSSTATNKVGCWDDDQCPFTVQVPAVCHPLCDAPGSSQTSCPEDYVCAESGTPAWSDWWFCEPIE